ncbi:cupin domain-containing protein [Pseudonocardia spinosispora]|uniref:cupin domain-containing protein n=1 Tax=Pseudonocardia spinosispora TaxID=103441 RepID=UPI00048B2EF7|nr:cupin domain-containing protein [Pseudonocardia spinosispora]
MSTESSMAGYEWASVAESPARELFPGIHLHSLWKGDGGAAAYVLKMDPHTRWRGIDVHDPGPEEVYVISGVFNDGERDYPEGSFIHAPAGSSHVPQTTTGCTLFLFYPHG